MAEQPDMKGFLTQYFMHRIFNAMPDEQFAQYQDIIKNNDFIGNMKDWKDKWHLVINVNGEWIKNENGPNPNEFKVKIDDTNADEAWNKLYKELRNAFRTVASGRDRLDPKDDKKTLEYLDAFYGFGQLFSPAELRGPAKDQLSKELIPFLKANKSDLLIVFNELAVYSGSDKDFDKFITDLEHGKHNTDATIRDALSRIVNTLRGAYGSYISEHIGGAPVPNLDVLKEGLENDDVDPDKVKHFKDNYKYILNPLQSEKNIYKNFAPHLQTVKTAIETAQKNVDYNNAESKDFLKEKRPDEQSTIEKTISNVKNWWGDHTDKYVSLHKSRLFYSDEAKAISKAIDGTKFKPTDGLDKFVESLKTIGDKVKGNKAKQHFKWFSETLTKLHGDKQMSSIFAGALKNPRKMKELIAELAIQGIKDGKKDEEIFTAMEVLKTIQYGYATSNHLNAVMKQDLSLFSDKSLSWNKHEGMAVVMKGLDKTINFGIKGSALLLTTGYNILNRNIGNKFGGKVPKRAAAAFAAREDQLNAQRADKQAEKTMLDELDTKIRDQGNADQKATGITRGTLRRNQRNLRALRSDEETKKTTLDTAQTNFNTAEANFNTADQALKRLNDTISAQDERNNKLSEINTQLAELAKKIKEIDDKHDKAKHSEIAMLSNLLTQQEALEAQKASLTKEITDNATAYTNAQAGLAGVTTARNNAETARNNAETARNNAQSEYNTVSNEANDLASRIEKFQSARQRINDATARLAKREEEFEKWENEDKTRFGRLMAHWDFLNSGRMRTGENVFRQVMEGILPLSQKDRQDSYNKRRANVHDAFLQRYQQEYGLAA